LVSPGRIAANPAVIIYLWGHYWLSAAHRACLALRYRRPLDCFIGLLPLATAIFGVYVATTTHRVWMFSLAAVCSLRVLLSFKVDAVLDGDALMLPLCWPGLGYAEGAKLTRNSAVGRPSVGRC
jgi:hypothetical protein